jgi:hypothetical protein
MGIAFDEGAADALITAANSADEVLRAEGGFLHGAVEQAVQDFNGGYGRLFKDACGIRSDDRGKLSLWKITNEGNQIVESTTTDCSSLFRGHRPDAADIRMCLRPAGRRQHDTDCVF